MSEKTFQEFVLEALEQPRVVSFETREEEVEWSLVESEQDEQLDRGGKKSVRCAEDFYEVVADIYYNIHDDERSVIKFSSEFRWDLSDFIVMEKDEKDFLPIWKSIRTLCRMLDNYYNPTTYDQFVAIWEKWYPGVDPLVSFY